MELISFFGGMPVRISSGFSGAIASMKIHTVNCWIGAAIRDVSYVIWNYSRDCMYSTFADWHFLVEITFVVS